METLLVEFLTPTRRILRQLTFLETFDPISLRGAVLEKVLIVDVLDVLDIELVVPPVNLEIVLHLLLTKFGASA